MMNLSMCWFLPFAFCVYVCVSLLCFVHANGATLSAPAPPTLTLSQSLVTTWTASEKRDQRDFVGIASSPTSCPLSAVVTATIPYLSQSSPLMYPQVSTRGVITLPLASLVTYTSTYPATYQINYYRVTNVTTGLGLGSGLVYMCGALNVTVDTYQQFQLYPADAPLAGGAGKSIFLNSRAKPNELESVSRIRQVPVTLKTLTQTFIQYNTDVCSPPVLLPTSTGFTAELWFKTTLQTEQGQQKGCCWPLLTAGEDFALEIRDAGQLKFYSSAFASDTCQPMLQLTNTTDNKFKVDFRDNKWHHVAVAVTVDTGNNNGEKNMYVDGSLWITMSSCSLNPDFKAKNIYVGQRVDTETAAAEFDGWMDEVRIWTVARTQQQIRDTMYRTLNEAEKQSLLVYYTGDDANNGDLILRDASGHGLDAELGHGLIRQAPTFPPSDAPVYGSHVQVEMEIAGNTAITKPIFLPAIQNTSGITSSQVTATINITSIPSYVILKEIATDRILSVGMSVQVPRDTITSHSVSSHIGFISAATTSHAAIQSLAVDHRLVDEFTYVATMNGVTSPPARVSIGITRRAPPVTGSAGGMLYCDGAYHHGFAPSVRFQPHPVIQDNTNVTSLGPYTIEFWANFESSTKAGTVFAMGNAEVKGAWCVQQTPSSWGSASVQEAHHCNGRIVVHLNDWMDVYGGWEQANNDNGHIGIYMKQTTDVWSHIAIVYPGSSSDRTRVYVNGIEHGSSAYVPIEQSLEGLTLCHWNFWGDFHYFRGYLDEFRIWNSVRTVEQIRNNMYSSVKAEPTLMVYYNFNDVSSTNYYNSTASAITDNSGNNHTLILGACTPNEEPFCLLGKDKCEANKLPQVPCYITPTQSVDPKAVPLVVPSTAPVGGYHAPLVTSSTSSPSSSMNVVRTVSIPLSMPVSSLAFTSTAPLPSQLPTAQFLFPDLPIASVGYLTTPNGTKITSNTSLYTISSVNFTAADGGGGQPYTTIPYRTFDGLSLSPTTAAVEISVMCNPGNYLDNMAKRCIACPAGTYSDTSSFATSCIPCAIGTAQPMTGATSCNVCDPAQGVFQANTGAAQCSSCEAEDFPAPCTPTANIRSSTQTGLWIMLAIGVICVLACLLLVIVFRTHRVIFSASAAFLIATLTGTLLCLVGAALFIPNQTATTCTAKIWFLVLGWELFLASILAKTYRLDRIFNNRVLASVSLTNRTLFVRVAVLVAIDIIILLVWSIAYPVTIVSPLRRECISDASTSFLAIILSIKAIQLAYTIYLCIRTRNIPSRYNESKFTSMTVYNLLMVVVVLVILAFGLGSNNISTISILLCVGITYAVISSCALLFGIKFYAIYSQHGSEAWVTYKSGRTDRVTIKNSSNQDSSFQSTKCKTPDAHLSAPSTSTSMSTSTSAASTTREAETKRQRTASIQQQEERAFLIAMMDKNSEQLSELIRMDARYSQLRREVEKLEASMNKMKRSCVRLQWEIEYRAAKSPELMKVVQQYTINTAVPNTAPSHAHMHSHAHTHGQPPAVKEFDDIGSIPSPSAQGVAAGAGAGAGSCNSVSVGASAPLHPLTPMRESITIHHSDRELAQHDVDVMRCISEGISPHSIELTMRPLKSVAIDAAFADRDRDRDRMDVHIASSLRAKTSINQQTPTGHGQDPTATATASTPTRRPVPIASAIAAASTVAGLGQGSRRTSTTRASGGGVVGTAQGTMDDIMRRGSMG